MKTDMLGLQYHFTPFGEARQSRPSLAYSGLEGAQGRSRVAQAHGESHAIVRKAAQRRRGAATSPLRC